MPLDTPVVEPTPRDQRPGAGPRHDRSPVNGTSAPAPDLASPFRAALRHPLAFLLPVIVCTAIGVAAGLARQPTWTADTRVALGSIDVATQSLPGYVEATKSLAAAYSRAIQSTEVVSRASRASGIPPAEVGDRLSASPVADTPILSVTATGPDERAAVTLANAGTDGLLRYVRRSTSQDISQSLLRDYERQQDRVQRLRSTRDRLERADAQAPGSISERELERANADYAAAQLQAEVLAQRFRNNQQNRPAPDFIRVLSDATTATSDKASGLQLRAFTGIVVGVVLGLVAAVVVASRRRLARG
jgi:capsular polysaccharide biosynthesis protein